MHQKGRITLTSLSPRINDEGVMLQSMIFFSPETLHFLSKLEQIN